MDATSALWRAPPAMLRRRRGRRSRAGMVRHFPTRNPAWGIIACKIRGRLSRISLSLSSGGTRAAPGPDQGMRTALRRRRGLRLHQFPRLRIERFGLVQRLAQRFWLHPPREHEVAAGRDAFSLLQGKALEVTPADIVRHFDGALMSEPQPLQHSA